jgi:outer membrane immunogenic protein
MKTLLATASFLVLSSASVLAADLPMSYKSSAPVVAPVFSWTGCYIGVHGGGGAMDDTFNNLNGSGGLAGGQVGCNYQDGNWVFGGEAEGYWSGIKSTRANSVPRTINGEGFRDVDTARNKSDFSIAARAGIAFDRTFVYGKAGWVWGKFDFNVTDTSPCCAIGGGPFLLTENASGTLNGLLIGVGVEHAITRNVTVKLEYNFLRYGGKELNFTECRNDSTPACATFTNTQSADKHIFKIGANYLFNMGGAPLVAKY